MNSRLRTVTLLASLVLFCLIAALSFSSPAPEPPPGSHIDGGREDRGLAHASASETPQSTGIEEHSGVQREPVAQDSEQDASSRLRPSLPTDPGLRAFAILTDRALNDWDVKTYRKHFTGPKSVERSGHFNPDGISLKDYEIRELERLLDEHNKLIEQAHRVQDAEVYRALARAIRRGDFKLAPAGDSPATDSALDNMFERMDVSRDDKNTYYFSVNPSDVKGFNRVAMVTRMTDPAPFALNDRLSETKQRRSAAIRSFMARCYAVRGLPYDENR